MCASIVGREHHCSWHQHRYSSIHLARQLLFRPTLAAAVVAVVTTPARTIRVVAIAVPSLSLAAPVLLEAHKLRVERGDYNIAEIHLADAIEAIILRSQQSLSDDRTPKKAY